MLGWLKLFSEANRALNTGLFGAALAKYQEALKSWEHPAIYYNMALAQMNLDQPIEVEKSLTKAIAYGPKPLEKDKFEHAQQYLAVNAKLLAWVDVSCKKMGANVFIDDEKVFTVTEGQPNRVERRVKVGKHTIVAERTGYNAQVDAPLVGPGEKFRIELQLYTSDELTRYTRRWKQQWMPFAVIGGGVALGLFGAVMASSAQGSYDKFDTAISKCNDESLGMGCVVTSGVSGLRDSGDTKKTVAYIGYGLAGAAVVAGSALLYLNRRTSYEISADQYRKELAKKPKVAVTPLVAPSTAGAMILGSF
jgi:tetratricopeptide (TPR) repeat protein